MSKQRPSRDRRSVLGAELLRAMQELLTRGLSDPRVQGLITVTGLDVAHDLKTAVVRVSVLPERNEARVLAGLTHAASHLRHELGEALDSDRIPQLRFAIDRGPKQQAAVVAALSRAARERESSGAAPGPLDPATEAANNPPEERP